MKNVRVITAIVISGIFMASCSEQDTFENYLEPITSEIQNADEDYTHPERMLEPVESINDKDESNESESANTPSSSIHKDDPILEEIKPKENKLPVVKNLESVDQEAPTREREPILKEGVLEMEPSNPDYVADKKAGTAIADSDVIKPIERTEFLGVNEAQK